MNRSGLAAAVFAVAAQWACAAAGIVVHSATTNGVEVRWFEEMVPMKDGTRLYTYGALPPEGETRGIVFARNPYKAEKPVDMPAHAYSQLGALARGYAYVYQHVRGTGMSEGAWTPYEDEREDGLAALEWLRRLPHYGGELFLLGGSYGSSVHWSYLDTNPPDVKGAALAVQDVKRYNVAYRNGFFKIGLHGDWFVHGYHKKDKSLCRNRDVSFVDFPLAAFSRRYWGEGVPSLDNMLRHPRPDDPFWRSREPGAGADYLDSVAKSTVPILLRTAFYDIYTDGVCAMWRSMTPERRANCALVIDAYDHGGRMAQWAKGTRGEFPGGSRADSAVSDLDWFDFCRTGRPVANALPGRTRYYALWENAWKSEPELVDGARAVRLPLGKGAKAWTYDPRRPLPKFPGSGGICFGGMRLQPSPNFRDDVVSFVLPPLGERLDVRGRMEAELAVSSDCEDTCIYVRVSVDKGDGRWYLLRDDITSLSFAGGRYAPGEERKVPFRFADHAFRLEKGDVLRVDVASANSQFAPHPNVAGDAFSCADPKVAHNTVFPERSFLLLHVDADGALRAEEGHGASERAAEKPL
ncbi:MAG: CocE/NonD family hydrolase [Kiritimatiellae bacterium]|nr:CocE/NonD family hydrolase [Kiritimatiellia bacterium]